MTVSRRTRLAIGIVALLLVAVASDSRQRLSLPLERSAVGRVLGDAGAIAFGVAGVMALALLLTMAARLRRKKPEEERVDDRPHSRLARFAASLAAVAMIVIPVVLIVAARHHGARQTQSPPTVSPSAIRGRSNTPTVPDATSIAIGAVVGAAFVVALVWWLWRRRFARDDLIAPAGIPTMTPDDVAAATALSGAMALENFRDPRRAILACYTAMRAALVRFGLPARAADTPTDFLLRVTTTEVAAVSVRELTTLFHEARFSTHPMTITHRSQAEDALREIARSISDHERRRGGES